MEEGTSTDNEREKYMEILRLNEITEAVSKVEIDRNPGGGGLVCQLNAVTVTFTNEVRPPLKFFVKLVCKSEAWAKEMEESRIFEKEARFFSQLLPDLTRLTRKHNLYDGYFDTVSPKCYLAQPDLLVLEDLRPQGFKVLDYLIPHSFTHARLAITTLAKFHATTYALIKDIGEQEFRARYPFVYEASKYSESGLPGNAPCWQAAVDGALKILRERPSPGSDRALRHLSQFESDAYLKLCRHFNPDNPSCATVVNHGDFWSTNVLFKVGSAGDESPSDCTIIDFQTIYPGSPALDLQHYIFIAMDRNIRQKELLPLLQQYYKTFEDCVKRLGQEMSFQFEDLLTDFKNKCEPGFVFGAMYRTFGLEIMSKVIKEAEDGEEIFGPRFLNCLDQFMDEKGEYYSREITVAFEDFEKLHFEGL